MADGKTSVLFVCLGNICRSPLAEGVFTHLARERGVLDRFEIDSAGTGGWHVGARADERMLATAANRGVELASRARKVDEFADFPDLGGQGGFDRVIAMDQSNLEDLRRLGCPNGRLTLLRSHDPAMAGRDGADLDVPDPYYGEDDGFDRVFEMVEAACNGLLDELTA